MIARVLVVNDDVYELATLAGSLRLTNVNVVGEAFNATIAENLFRSLSPEVALLDIAFSTAGAIALAHKFRKANPAVGLVITTSCPDLRLLGYLEKEIPSATQLVLKGSVLDLSVLSHAIDLSLTAVEAHEKMAWVKKHGSINSQAFSSILDQLTDTQVETFRLVALGLSNSEIGRVRFVSEKSVEQIVARIAAHLQIEPDRTHNLRVIMAGQYYKWVGSPRH